MGSGVLLDSVWDDSRGTYSTFLLTAWHVVRDIQGDLSNTRACSHHELLQFLNHTIDLPAVLLNVLGPLEVTDGHAASIGHKVWNGQDSTVVQDLLR